MLEWFSQISTKAGKELFALIAERRLFKRIFVLSKEGGTDKALWENVTDYYRSNRRNWRAKLSLQNNFQRRLTEFVEQPPAGQTLSQPFDPTLRNKFLAEARDKILLLIDIPPERKASNIPLEYLVEEDRQRFKREEVKIESLEPSIVWKAIQNSFQESLGKLRLFCHPDYSEFLSRSIPRKTIESILSASLKEAERTLAKS